MKSETRNSENSMISLDTEQKLSCAIELLIKVAATINLNAISGTVKACGEHLGLLKICLKAAHERDPNNNAKFASAVIEHIKTKKLGDRPLQSSPNKNSSEYISDEISRLALETRYECYNVALECLNSVFEKIEQEINNQTTATKDAQIEKPSLDIVFSRKVENLWRFCLESKDQLWHYALYDYLNGNNTNRARLTRLDTPYIQNWFDYVSQESPENNALLYAEWLESSERYSDASKILYKLAILDQANAIQPTNTADPLKAEHFNLNFRIQLLSKSLADAKASSDSELVEKVTDRLDVAELQNTVVKLLKHKAESNPEIADDYVKGIQVAETKLISLSDLYQAFGESQNMPEVQLLVLHCAGQGDVDLIDHLWRLSIDNSLTDDQGNMRFDTGNPEICVNAIREKVLFLSRTFLTSRSTANNLESLRHSSKYIGLGEFLRKFDQVCPAKTS